MSLERVRKSHAAAVAPPPPKPQPKPLAAPKPAPQNAGAGAAAKKGEVENRGALARQKVEKKELELVGATVAGAVAGSRAPTSTAEKVGFAPRTAESARAARVVRETVNREIAAGNLFDSNADQGRQQTIGAAIHKNGAITVTASGDGETTKAFYDEKLYNRAEAQKRIDEAKRLPASSETPAAAKTPKPTPAEIAQRRAAAALRQQQKADGIAPANEAQIKEERAARANAGKQDKAAQQLRDQRVAAAEAENARIRKDAPSLKDRVQTNLNEAFRDNPNVKRVNVQVDFDWGRTSSEMNPRTASQRGPNGISTMDRTADNCAAGKMYNSERSQNGRNPVVAADEVWRPADSRSVHQDKIKLNNGDGHSMCPCSSCTTNADKVKAGNFTPERMTVRSGLQTARTGAITGAAASTLEQLWNTGTADAGKLASDTALGAGTAVVGEGIERAVTPGATRLAERAAQKFVNDGTQTAATRVLTTGGARTVGSTVGRLAGAGAGGAVIGAGMEIYNQRDNFADPAKRPDAVGAVVGQAVVGIAAGVAGAQAGAVIGSFIPIPGVGTVAGAAVGFAVGYAFSATGADKAIAGAASSAYRGAEEAVGSAVNAVSGAADKVAGWLGW